MLVKKVLLFFLLSLVGLSGALADTTTQKHPNIIFILLDDLDYADVGVYGSPDISTPTLDEFAGEGMRFDHYYVNAPVCSPSRTSLLTGRHPAHFGVKRAILDRSFRGIPAGTPTIAELLKQAGYRTAHIGKWHLGANKPEFLPTAKGFDHSVRLDTGKGLGYSKFRLSVDDAEPQESVEGDYLTRILTDRAIDFISEAAAGSEGQPFFLNLWYLAPHKPLFDLPPDFDNGKTGYCLRSDQQDSNCDSLRGNYAALVGYVDSQISRILQVLDEKPGLKDNTLVIISSDNGGERATHNQAILPQRPVSGFKGSVKEGALRVPMMVKWPGVVIENTVNASVISGVDLLPTVAELAGVELSESGLAGDSFLDTLKTGNTRSLAKLLVWENKFANKAFSNDSGVFNTYAVRSGDWKLVMIPATRRGEQNALALYNLENDPGETSNLLAPRAKPLYEIDVMGYRLAVNGGKEASSGSQANQYRLVVDDLQRQYFDWRREQGDIAYQPVLSGSGVTLDGATLAFSGGAATVARDTRLDFHDGDFSFAARINPESTDGISMVAEKPGSWRLLIERGSLKLVMYEHGATPGEANPGLVLQVPVQADSEQHIAFTVFGWRDTASTVRLYLDGKLVDESGSGNGIDSVQSRDVAGEPMLWIGNNSENSMPFQGTVSLPRLSVLSFYPAEILWDFVAH
jgi:arylsulfatase A-like enzyme